LKPVAAQVSDQLRNFYQQIIDTYEQELAKARKEGPRWQEVQVLNNAGLAYKYFGNFPKALELLQQALSIAREIPDRARETEVLRNFAATYSSMGDYQGIDFLEQQLQLTRQKGDRDSPRIVLGQLALAYSFVSNYQKAIETYEQYLPLLREINDRKEEAQSLSTLSIAYNSVKDSQKAIALMQQALAIAQELGDNDLKSQFLSQLSGIYQFQGNGQKVIELSEQVLQIAKDTKNPQQEMIALEQVAINYAALGNSQKVISLLEQAIAISQTLDEYSRKFQKARFLEELSRTYAHLGNDSKGIDLQKQSVELYRLIKNEFLEAGALNQLGFLLLRAGQFKEAETALRSAIVLSDRFQQTVSGNVNLLSMTPDELNRSTYEASLDTYRTLQQVLVATNRTDEALEVAEAGRSRAFVELLTRRLAVDTKSLPKITPPNIEQIKQIAKAENSTLVQYSIIYDDIQQTISSRLKFKKTPPQETTLFIWVVKPTGEVTFTKVELQPLLQQNIAKSTASDSSATTLTLLQNFVSSTRESIGVRGRGLSVVTSGNQERPTNTRYLQQLYQILIQPIAGQLPTDPKERITFIPQGSLFLIPFSALQDPTGKYLIEKHTILTAPSIQVLDLTHQARQRLQKSATPNALIVGNPTMPSLRPKLGAPPEPLPSLPGTEIEAKAIAQLLNTEALLGSQATEAAVVQRLSSARIIHLATHGILDNFLGLQSAIALAPSEGRFALAPDSPSSLLGKGGQEGGDGFLTAREVLNLKLNAELAVLSACDTGRGAISGDGVVGISRSFIGAGVPSVIVSLWSVPDAPTASLMTEFYRNLQQNPDKAQALRSAMLTTMKQYPNPKDWAAFTLIGEAE
jgi:CHAT domain-containing protein